jgi:gliding motility-associated lipoprotein GldH
MKFHSYTVITLVACLFLTGCQRTSVYHHSVSIPTQGWDQNGTLYFNDSLRNNVPEKLHLQVELRHNNLYPYQNLWIYLRIRTSEGINRFDSINWTLTKPNGRWIGDGWGSMYSMTHQLPDLSIRKKFGVRWFSIEVQHGLKNPTLNGIETIGVHLFTDKPF